jgi:hypothetical protein
VTCNWHLPNIWQIPTNNSNENGNFKRKRCSSKTATRCNSGIPDAFYGGAAIKFATESYTKVVSETFK